MSRTVSPDRADFSRPRFLPGVELVSVSYRDRAFPVHAHDGYVVGTVIGGAEQLDVAGASHLVGTGDVLRLHPGEPHANRSLGAEALRYLVLYLSPDSVAPYLSGEARLTFRGAVSGDRQLAATVASVHAALRATPEEKLAQESAMMLLVRVLAASDAGAGEPAAGSERAVVARVQDWIEAHLADNFGLAELATVAGLSVFRLAHLFKQGTGVSPIAWRNQRRIAAARRLLLAGQPIADIALQLGFADQSHLTRQFQRIVGVSPQRYRQQ
ncbi:AraC family transcriptional regulator [Sphingomonas lycopersici]|uniref:AraC family transcriptional regulator n=1 Tax=Sphingomonas lycopersici TaxID=2951807 RepID=UPI0015CDF617|nr:AraC family transcriptional regulator [Sphingomonas lycopersici]